MPNLSVTGVPPEHIASYQQGVDAANVLLDLRLPESTDVRALIVHAEEAGKTAGRDGAVNREYAARGLVETLVEYLAGQE